MISRANLFFIWFLISFSLSLEPAGLTWAYSLEELKKALQGDDVEVAWKGVEEMPQKISPQQRAEAIKLLKNALKKEWTRCAGDIRQSLAMQLATINAKEAIPDLLELIKKKKNINHECAE